jgi:hypothetical protein
MSALESIIRSDKKPKEKVTLLAEKVKENKGLITELVKCFTSGSATVKGHCMEALQHVSLERPDIVLPHIDFIIDQLQIAMPRVKWEAARTIHNLAQKYPDSAATAVPKLLANVNDSGTVTRWSAAQALTEILYHNPGLRDELIPKFNAILKKEKNNGVRNIYLKALKSMEQKKGK